MRRNRSSRILALIGSVAMVGSLLLSAAGGAFAANTRVVGFGSPPITPGSDWAGGNYHLNFTPVASGGVTSVYVLVRNDGSGTLNHVIVQGGTLATDPRENPGFVPDGSNGKPPICTVTATVTTCVPSLPDGFAYTAAFAPSGVACSDADGTAAEPTLTNGAGLSCDIGQLASQASVTLRIAVQVPAYNPAVGAANSYKLWFTMSGNEGTSGSGSNQDAFFALGTVDVQASTPCSASTFFVSGEFVGFGPTPTGCSGQLTTLTAGTFAEGAFASVKIRASTTAEDLFCKPYKCFGQVSEGNVEFGEKVPGGLKWTIAWLKSSLSGTPSGVIHFFDPVPARNPPYEFIFFKTTPQCAASGLPTFPCLDGKPGSVRIDGKTYFQAVFRTETNGGNRGL